MFHERDVFQFGIWFKNVNIVTHGLMWLKVLLGHKMWISYFGENSFQISYVVFVISCLCTNICELIHTRFCILISVSAAPSPTTAINYLATKCVDTVKTKGPSWFMPWGPDQCSKIRDFEEATAKRIEANNIVFAVHIPPPNREMSPWFQFMLVILQFDIAFNTKNQIGECFQFIVWLL